MDHAIAAHLAEALGAIAVLMNATVEYAKTRKQFGQPIGKFQVLQHRMVDMFIAQQQAQSASLMANLKLGDADGARAVSAAKAAVGKYAKQVGESAVQIHGGIGMTEELNVGHYFKRLTSAGNALWLARPPPAADGGFILISRELGREAGGGDQ